MSAENTLAVRLPNPLGDVVAAAPIFDALRRGLPETRLVGLGRGKVRELLNGLDSIDAFLALPPRQSRGGLRAE